MSQVNGVMMQYFHWYSPADGSLWNQLAKSAKDLAKIGVTSLWLPLLGVTPIQFLRGFRSPKDCVNRKK